MAFDFLYGDSRVAWAPYFKTRILRGNDAETLGCGD